MLNREGIKTQKLNGDLHLSVRCSNYIWDKNSSVNHSQSTPSEVNVFYLESMLPEERDLTKFPENYYFLIIFIMQFFPIEGTNLVLYI